MANADRQKRAYLVMGAAVVLWVGGFALVAANPGMLDFFKSEGSSAYTVSGDRMAEIVGEIRKHTREKWIEKLVTVEDAVGKMDDYRHELFDEIATAGKGEAYLQELKRLSENHHQKLEPVDIADPEISLERVFEAVKNAEKKLTNYYRDVVAAKNAIRMEVPAIDAVSWVKVVPPKRIQLDRQALDQEVRSKGEPLDSFKRNVNVGGSEIDAMLKYADKMLEKAGLDGGDGTGQGWQQISDTAFGSTQGETLLPDELSLDDEGTSEGGFNAVPGRFISNAGSSNRNLYIDRWYVIGPFENRFRSNLDASFMPESVIDLDSTTIGKDGEEISWEYWRMPKQRIEPDWAPRGAVYYAWTEVWVEEAGKYWMSLGSDDYGKMWINGDLVWKSDTRPKSYRADEHTEEFEFKQGINEILFRCENNGGTMGFSVIFHLSQEY